MFTVTTFMLSFISKSNEANLHLTPKCKDVQKYSIFLESERKRQKIPLRKWDAGPTIYGV